jgi:hypothetical protein
MTSYHCSIDIGQMLLKPNKREWKNFEDNATLNGKKMSAAEWEQLFRKRYNAGDRLFPLGQCDNFDPIRGCGGHEEMP